MRAIHNLLFSTANGKGMEKCNVVSVMELNYRSSHLLLFSCSLTYMKSVITKEGVSIAIQQLETQKTFHQTETDAHPLI